MNENEREYQKFEDQVSGIFSRKTGLLMRAFFPPGYFQRHFNCGYLPETALYEETGNMSRYVQGLVVRLVPGAMLPDLFSVTYKGPVFTYENQPTKEPRRNFTIMGLSQNNTLMATWDQQDGPPFDTGLTAIQFGLDNLSSDEQALVGPVVEPQQNNPKPSTLPINANTGDEFGDWKGDETATDHSK